MAKVKDRKITVSLAADLADSIDQHVQEIPSANRSKIFEEALRVWETLHQYGNVQEVLHSAMLLYQKEQERELYRSYYANVSDDLRDEARGWRTVAEDSLSLRAKKDNQGKGKATK